MICSMNPPNIFTTKGKTNMAKKHQPNEIPYQEIPDKYRLLYQGNIYGKSENRFLLDYRLKNSAGVCIKHSTKTFASKDEAAIAGEKLRVEHALAMYRQDHPGCLMTFEEVCEEYLKSRLRKDKPGTIVTRLSILKSRILPFFGDIQIKELGTDDIEEWHDRFRTDDGEFIFTDTYLRSLHSRLSAVLNYAVARGYIDSNPAKFIKIGEKNAPARPVWDVTEYRAFRKAIEDKPMAYYAFETLYNTGMRRGELLALSIGDIDFSKRVISITKSLSRIRGEDVIRSPKTKKSKREIVIGETLCNELKEHIQTLHDTSPSGRVFPVSISYLRNSLDFGTKAAGLKPITIHCFRHSHISNLIYKGFSAVDVAERVGHESTYITFRYAHAFNCAQERMAKAIDELMKEV